ncbi:hypothetical protein FPHYL_14022 [Fusarium phyllophilum]|uniref:Uncharacterized protein n=1 Tax=Fusarium phyllophilum TaxID=47803 RepID=A0A8H5IAH9_9HYPO|nr:hypothetical protein FPHYL_14022 [Fusarium phyllophilum]
MPQLTKTQAAVELVRIRGEISRLEREVSDMAWELTQVQAKKAAAYSIMLGNFAWDEKVIAQQQHREFVRQEADLKARHEPRRKELDKLRTKEEYLKIDLL